MRAEGNRFFVGLDLEALFEIKILELAIYGRQKIFENSCHRGFGIDRVWVQPLLSGVVRKGESLSAGWHDRMIDGARTFRR